jgi:dipeptidyl aminopeptidase/acylaminoacyl peptidase
VSARRSTPSTRISPAVLTALRGLSDGDLAGISCDDSGQRWVVSFTHDRDPYATYLYDRLTGESRLLFRPYPQLDPAALAPMTPITLTARDGLDLHGYLTLPVDVPAQRLPLVLLVHGGPWARDTWGYQPDVQLLAQRGICGCCRSTFAAPPATATAFTRAAIGEFAGGCTTT